MKEFVGKSQTQKVPFMDGEVEVRLLTVGDAQEIDRLTKELASKEDKEDSDNLELLRSIIRMMVIGADELSNEDFDTLPIASLTSLVETITQSAGVEGNE